MRPSSPPSRTPGGCSKVDLQARAPCASSGSRSTSTEGSGTSARSCAMARSLDKQRTMRGKHRGGNDMATELTVKVPNRAGQLAAISMALGDAKVNIAALAGSALGSKGVIHVVVADKDAARARRALKKAR